MLRFHLGLAWVVTVVLSACSSAGGASDPLGSLHETAGTSAVAGNAATSSSGNNSGGNASGGAGGTLAMNAGSGGQALDAGSSNSIGGAAAGSAAAGKGGSSGSAGSPGGAAGTTCSATAGPITVTDLAFPEAEGFGRHATGGRAGKVYHVTNLNDSGPGSFRDAVSASDRIVVFDVGGYVVLKTAVSAKSNLTIAGQTAPGGGIGFQGGEISFANSSNIIVRHVRIRPGADTASNEDDALSLYLAKNVLVDHASLEFAPWNNIDGVSDDWQAHPVTDITFQDSLIADPTGQQFGAHTESVSSQWSWYRNVFANSHNRNPLAKVNNVFVNNVLYNCSAGYTTHTSTNFTHDIVNNYFVFGPASTGTDNTWYQLDKNQSIYFAGNLKDSNLNGVLDGAETTPYWYQGAGTILSAAWSTMLAETTLSAPSAYRVAVSRAGALPRDAMDALIVSQVRTLGKGTTGTSANTVGPDGALYTTQTQTGLSNDGYGEIASGTPPLDTDQDGMPDFWEQLSGSNPALDDAMQKASDGYALIEHYLNWLAEPHALTAANASVDLDLATFTLGFSDATPSFSVTQPGCGAAQLRTDGHSVHFTPATGFSGLTSFDYQVTGKDGTQSTGRITLAVQR